MNDIEDQFQSIAKEYIQVEEDVNMSAYELQVNWPSLKKLIPKPPQWVLDYGAGSGIYSQLLLKLGYQVLATDNSPAMVREIAAKGVKSQLWTYTEPPIKQLFDVILAKLVVQFVDDLDLFAAKMRKQLATGGKVIISIPHPDRSRPQVKPGDNKYETQIGQSGLHVTMIHRELEEIVQSFEKAELKLVDKDAPVDTTNNESPKRLNLVFEAQE